MAEIVSFDDLVGAGYTAEGLNRGELRLKGKDYVMVDADVVALRFKV